MVVEADESVATNQVQALKEAGTALTLTAGSLAEAWHALQGRDWDLVLLELALADGSGSLLAQEIVRREARPALVILSDRFDLLMACPHLNKVGAIIAGKAVSSECVVTLATAALAASGRRAEPAKRSAENFSTRLLEFARGFRLTPREHEILTLLASGRPAKVIAAELGISYATVRYHAANLYRKCEGRSQRELLAYFATKHLSD